MKRDYNKLLCRIDYAYNDLKEPCINPIGRVTKEDIIDLLKDSYDAISEMSKKRNFNYILSCLARLESDANDIADELSDLQDDIIELK